MLQHYFAKIEGWFKFAPAYRRAVAEARDNAVFVEVGCWKGRSTAYLGVEILNSGKAVALHCVDLWISPELGIPSGSRASRCLRHAFERNMAPIVRRGLSLTVHSDGSPRAAARFEDHSVDFVWLDGAHGYDAVLADLQAWIPKLRPGAVIGGDDYPFPGVACAVREVLGDDVDLVEYDNWSFWRHRSKPPAP